MVQNLTLKKELQTLFQFLAGKITPEIRDFGGVAINGIRLMTRGKAGIPQSDKKGVEWLLDVMEKGTESTIDDMTPEQLQGLGETLCRVGYQLLIDTGAVETIKEGEEEYGVPDLTD